MAFLTSLLTAYGGYGKGRRANEQEQDTRTQLAQSQAYQDAQIKQQQADLAERKIVDAATLRGQGLDAQGQPLAPLPLTGNALPTMAPGPPVPSPVLNGKGQPVGPPAPGAPTAQPMTGDQFRAAAQQAAEAGNTFLFDKYSALATSADNAAWRDSIAALNTAKIPVEGSIANKNNAQATEALSRGRYYAVSLPNYNAARIQAMINDTGTTANAHVRAASIAAAGAAERAGLDAQSKQEVALLGGYFGMQRMSQEDATRAAIAQYTAASRIATADITATKDPNAAGTLPTLKLDVNTGGAQQIPIPIPDGKGGIKGYMVGNQFVSMQPNAATSSQAPPFADAVKQEVENAVKAGRDPNDPAVRAELLKHYPKAAVDYTLGPAPAATTTTNTNQKRGTVLKIPPVPPRPTPPPGLRGTALSQWYAQHGGPMFRNVPPRSRFAPAQ